MMDTRCLQLVRKEGGLIQNYTLGGSPSSNLYISGFPYIILYYRRVFLGVSPETLGKPIKNEAATSW